MSHLAICFPDWNSLDSVRRVHSDLEAAALICFALLVVFETWAHLAADANDAKAKVLEKIGLWCFAVAVLAEILAYPYGQRNDTLSGRIIGSLDAKASDAATNAANATLDSENAVTKASEAKGLAVLAKDAASAATKKSDQANEKLAGLNGTIQSAEFKLDTVEAKRKELEKSLINLAVCNAPRILTSWSVGTKTSVDPLRPYIKFKAILAFVPDFESSRAAAYIRYGLKVAGWSVVDASIAPNEYAPDGVVVESYSGASTETTLMPDREASRDAALAFVKFLHSYNWQARWVDGPSAEKDILPGTVKIIVGLYPPAEFVTPPAEKPLETESTDAPPDIKAGWKKMDEFARQSREKYGDEYGDIQPCQPLSVLAAHP